MLWGFRVLEISETGGGAFLRGVATLLNVVSSALLKEHQRFFLFGPANRWRPGA
jgi:hypothetical protein